MARIITVANQKGGVGKTTLTLNLGICLSRMGKRVCLLDCDPQANLTMIMGYHKPKQLPANLPSLMIDFINADLKSEESEILQKREYILKAFDMDFIPSNMNLTGVENILINEMNRENVLKKIVNHIEDDYDYILIDTMPSLNLMTINALNAADSVIVPMQLQYLSAKGLELLLSTIEKIQYNLNPNLKVDGILITMYDNRLTFHKEMLETIGETFNGLKIYETKIPISIRVAETQAKSTNIFDYDPNGKISESYDEFTKEFIKNEQKAKV
jgi:chromosome partitioning protein